MTEILKRKTDHIDLVLKQRLGDAEQESPWDNVILTHNALPEKDRLGPMSKVFIISSPLTGG